jgi:hypothetical protein
LNRRERQLLLQETGPAEPRLCVRSATRIDTGRWWGRSPAWLCLTNDELITIAVSRRRLFARAPLADCRASHYNPATGELVIQPAESLPIRHFKLSPGDALRILDFLKTDN